MIRNVIILIISLFFSLFYGNLFAQNQGLEIKTIVIDPGHGGKDPGCIKGKYQEKDIVLSVALKVGKIIKQNHPNVNVYYTRTSDKFIGLSERSRYAALKKADLFISIHVNSTGHHTSAHGVETWVMNPKMNAQNMDVCKKENSVITLEDDYTEKYSGFDPNDPESYIIFSLLQNSHLNQSLLFAEQAQKNLVRGPIRYNRGIKQAAFVVLWKCTMPSVLIELGFLSNYQDRKYLISSKGQNEIARRIANAISIYKDNYDTDYEVSKVPLDTSAPISDISSISGEEECFRIQIFVSSKLLDASDLSFQGYTINYIKVDGLYKYTIGHYKNRKEADDSLIKIRKSFPDAFIISYK
ncbi:MAG: N-acetylmuramoyl-L-alanine amidase [Bacteroidales bacterium]